MSHHPRRLSGPLRATLAELEGRARLHPPKVYAPALYFGCLTAPTGVRLLVAGVAEAALGGKVFSPSQAKLGQLYHRDRRTILRWVKVAVGRGWIRRTRRGRTMTNVYRLSRWLWGRLTGRHASKVPKLLQDSLWRIGLRIGVTPAKMHGAGLAPPGGGP
jgi:hypothetical protein